MLAPLDDFSLVAALDFQAVGCPLVLSRSQREWSAFTHQIQRVERTRHMALEPLSPLQLQRQVVLAYECGVQLRSATSGNSVQGLHRMMQDAFSGLLDKATVAYNPVPLWVKWLLEMLEDPAARSQRRL
jgi:hypothetical protein